MTVTDRSHGTDRDRVAELSVGLGQMRIAGPRHRLVASGLGSCVAIALYDGKTRLGRLAHIMLPRLAEAHNPLLVTKFADTAIGLMVDEMEKQGADCLRLTAKVFGGGNMFPNLIALGSPMDVGKRNVLTVRETLARLSIPIVAEVVGGAIGRTVVFDTSDGSIEVRTACLAGRMY